MCKEVLYILYHCIIAVKNVSIRMETEETERCKKQMEERNIPVKSITTDRNISVARFVREEWKSVERFFNIWHRAKINIHSLMIIMR